MIATRWAIGAGLLVAAAASGCVSCGYEACPAMLAAGPNAEAPLCDRQHVYSFLINGLTPDVTDGLEDLRLKLAERGYDKSYRGELCHAFWMAFEMKSILRCDPQARFVVVGYDFGCGPAAALARHARRQSWPIDAVVLIDPLTTPDANGCPPTVVVRAGGDCNACNDDLRYVNVADGSHWTLPVHERTVATIAEALKASAMKVEHPEVWVEPAEMEAPNRYMPVPTPGSNAEWHFLQDRLNRQFGPLTAPPGSPLPTPRKLEQEP
jgi:pimeloyl-ACP methyl ester carboxylesterase